MNMPQVPVPDLSQTVGGMMRLVGDAEYVKGLRRDRQLEEEEDESKQRMQTGLDQSGGDMVEAAHLMDLGGFYTERDIMLAAITESATNAAELKAAELDEARKGWGLGTDLLRSLVDADDETVVRDWQAVRGQISTMLGPDSVYVQGMPDDTAPVGEINNWIDLVYPQGLTQADAMERLSAGVKRTAAELKNATDQATLDKTLLSGIAGLAAVPTIDDGTFNDYRTNILPGLSKAERDWLTGATRTDITTRFADDLQKDDLLLGSPADVIKRYSKEIGVPVAEMTINQMGRGIRYFQDVSSPETLADPKTIAYLADGLVAGKYRLSSLTAATRDKVLPIALEQGWTASEDESLSTRQVVEWYWRNWGDLNSRRLQPGSPIEAGMGDDNDRLFEEEEARLINAAQSMLPDGVNARVVLGLDTPSPPPAAEPQTPGSAAAEPQTPGPEAASVQQALQDAPPGRYEVPAGSGTVWNKYPDGTVVKGTPRGYDWMLDREP